MDVPAVDLSALSPEDFADDELDLPYYLAHFQPFANSVRTMCRTMRGLWRIVWRCGSAALCAGGKERCGSAALCDPAIRRKDV